MKRFGVAVLLALIVPFPVFAAVSTAVGLVLFFLLYVVGFIFAMLLLVVFAQKGKKNKL